MSERENSVVDFRRARKLEHERNEHDDGDTPDDENSLILTYVRIYSVRC